MKHLRHGILKWISLTNIHANYNIIWYACIRQMGECKHDFGITTNYILKKIQIIASRLKWNEIVPSFPLNPRDRLIKKRTCRLCVLEGTPKMAAVESSLEQAEWAKNSWETGAATSSQEGGGLDREDEEPLRGSIGLDSTAGNHDNSAVCCRQDCLGMTVWLCVRWPQSAFSSFSCVYFETKSLPAKIKTRQ